METAWHKDGKKREELDRRYKVTVLMDTSRCWQKWHGLVTACAFGAGVCFCDNDRPDWLSRHSRSLRSTQPPVHSYQCCLCPSVWPPQAGRSVTRGWQKPKRERERGGTERVWWAGIGNSKSKELSCVIGGGTELRVNIQWQVCFSSPRRGMTVH